MSDDVQKKGGLGLVIKNVAMFVLAALGAIVLITVVKHGVMPKLTGKPAQAHSESAGS